MKGDYSYGYFLAGTGRSRGRRMTWAAAWRLQRRRKRHYDLEHLRGSAPFETGRRTELQR